jgi:lambda repressor-like predicted transcriptional regulator
MTITPITTSTTTGTQGATQPDFASRMQPLADLFHMSTTDLQNELRSGKSLADIAQEQGVSRDDLLATVKQGLQQYAPPGANLDAIANRIVDRTGGAGGAQGHHHHHHGGGGAGDATSSDSTTTSLDQVLGPVAEMLNTTTPDLMSQLQNGTSLRDIAQQAGVDPSQLLDTLGRGIAVNTLA